MATIHFNKSELEKYFKLNGKTLEKVNLFGTPINVNNEDVEVEIFPNRPDLIPMQGFVRAIKAFIGKDSGLKKYQIKKPDKSYIVKIDQSVSDIRPYTACAIVKKLTFNDYMIKQIIDLQEKLHMTIGRNRKKLAIGIYPLEKIILPIRYEARKPSDIEFVPLESNVKMFAPDILKKHPTGISYAHLLEGYDKFPIFVDAQNKILSMPPIINSNESGKITSETKEVFIECSGFDIDLLKKILNIIVTALADIGGEIYSMKMNYNKKDIITPDLTPQVMKFSIDNANKLLGLQLKEKEIEKLLKKMGHDYKNKRVLIAPWRTDLLHEVDIIEDIAIAYGYQNFEPNIPGISTIGQESPKEKKKDKISEILIGLGYLEISSYHLIKEEEIKKLKVEDSIVLESAKTEFKYLRPSLTPSVLRVLSENKDHEYPQKIFEIGKVFRLNEKEETGIKELENLIVASSPANFTDMKKILNYLFEMLNSSYELKESTERGLIEGRTGAIYWKNQKIGFIGELHPDTLNSWNIKMPAGIIEICIEEILNNQLENK